MSGENESWLRALPGKQQNADSRSRVTDEGQHRASERPAFRLTARIRE